MDRKNPEYSDNTSIHPNRPIAVAGLVLWIPVFTGKTIPGGFRQSVNGFD
jgi:hypothetical protein